MIGFGLGGDPRLQNKYFSRNFFVLKLYENFILGSAHIPPFVHSNQVVEI